MGGNGGAATSSLAAQANHADGEGSGRERDTSTVHFTSQPVIIPKVGSHLMDD